MAVSRRLRFEVLRRDGYTCRYCGGKSPDVTLTVDHVVPVTLGGDDDPRNLVTACADCNAGKSSIAPDSPIVEDVDATALLFARAVERAALIRAEQVQELEDQVAQFSKDWQVWHDDKGQPLPLPPAWRESIERFITLGLDSSFMARATRIAMERPRFSDRGGVFRYFCGVCWREVGERQELARRIIEDGEV